jgi:hypothetical protein
MNKRLASSNELKLVVKSIADALKLSADVASGFSLGQLGLLLNLGRDVQAVVAAKDVLVPQWMSMNDADRADLAAYIKATVEVPQNSSVESYAEKILGVASALSLAYQAIIDG